MIVQRFHFKFLHHWETPVQMVWLYNTSNCSFSVLFRPLFSLEAAVSVFASTSNTSMSLNSSLKTVPQILKFGISSPNDCSDSFLCNFQHFSVSINSFYGNKDYKTCGEFQITRDKIIIYVQVERIVISIRRELISLQFYLSYK